MKLASIYSFLVFMIIGNNISYANNLDSLALLEQTNELLTPVPALFNTNLDSAVLLMEQAIPLVVEAKNWMYYSELLNALSTAHFYRDDYENYKKYSLKAENNALVRFGEESLIYGESLNNLSILIENRGDYDESLRLLNRTLEIYLIKEVDKVKLATTYQNLAKIYRLKEDFQKSLVYRKKALEINRDTLDNFHPDIGSNLRDIGLTYKEMMQYDSSLVYLSESLKKFNKTLSVNNKVVQRNTISTYQGIADVWILKNNPEKANRFIQKAIRLQTKDNAFRKAYSYELLAKKFRLENNLSKAYDAIQTANNLALINYKGKFTSAISRKYLLTGEILNEQLKLDSAIIFLQKGIEILSPEHVFTAKFENPPIKNLLGKSSALDLFRTKANYLNQLGTNLKSNEYLLSSFNTYSKAIELIKDRRLKNLSASAKDDLAKKSLEIYEGAIKVALQLFHNTKDLMFLEKAFFFAENNKSMSLLESINDQFAKGNSAIPDSILAQEKNLIRDISFYQKKILEEKQNKEKAKHKSIKLWKDNLFSLQQEHEIFNRILEKDYPKYHSLKYKNEPASIKDLRNQLLQNNNALIEYFVGDKDIYIFGLTNDNLIVKTFPSSILTTEKIQAFRRFITTPPINGISASEISLFNNLSNDFYNLLIQPIIIDLNDDVDELFIIPDGVLCYIPFDVLLMHLNQPEKVRIPNYKTYLLHRFSIGYDYSATLLLKNSRRKFDSFDSELLAFAPSFGGEVTNLRDCNQSELNQLKCNQEEVQRIGEIFDGIIKVGKDANTSYFKKSTAKHSIIHLATHACVNPQNSVLNKIFFSDNAMTLLDFNNAHLNAELVVLSACNTGYGEIVKGEGVMSIAKGFMTAGSPSTMLSLWSVDDCSTSDLMGYYYKNLKAGNSKNKALQQAKIEFIENASTVQKHPFYWGAFVQFGNIKPIEFSSRFNWKLWTGGISFLLLIGYFLFKRRKTTNL